ncbi:TonB-dependent receptor [uncultured Dokdonia sp.]|uniref:TonB-dependent receptor domain-containing protein n=1 Tax=uncultured Dokdonia sp. TaxID=575653 RepID=UPI00261FE0B3|nr:TonB-dependent receptor [uncultured Dokdonia sp.]
MKSTIIFVLLLLFVFSLQAQSPQGKEITLSGKVQDKEGAIPLEYATITLINKRNPEAVNGGITTTNGTFSIKTPAGLYDIKIEYISFQPVVLKDQKLFKNTSLGTINLEIDAATLEEVTVIAEKTTVEYKLDKQIYNIGKDLTVRGASVSDVLDNVPSVTVDVEGNVALRGNGDVRILINGKPSGLIGLSGTDALRQLPAESIERVEVITSPSARYDAEGSAGILNIILRRSKLQGLNGAVTANIGNFDTRGISGNVNYRTGDFNIFATGGYNIRGSEGNTFTSRIQEGGSLIEDREFTRERGGLTANFGVEYYIDDNTSITAAAVVRDSDNENESLNNITQTSGDDIFLSQRFAPETEEDLTSQFSLNFDKKWENDGNLSIEFQYENSEETEFVDIRNSSLNTGTPTELETNETIEDQKRFFAQVDFVQPLGDNARFEAGYRGNIRDLDTDFIVFDNSIDEDNENGDLLLNTDLTNSLIFKENIHALYTQYGSKINKFNFLLGLRMEYTDIEIDQQTVSDFNSRDFTNFFPTVNLNYELNEKETVSFGYNRRIRRPRGFFLNPFPSRTSATTFFQGNPNLNPSLSNGVDLGYLNKISKSLTLNGSIFFRRTEDTFQFVFLETGETTVVNGEEEDVLTRTPVNLSRNDRIGAEATLTYSPTKKWRVNANVNVFNSETAGEFDGIDFGASNFTWTARLNNKYTLPWRIDWQTRINYRGPSVNAQSENEGIFSADFAFSKDLFKEKASLALNIRDIFNSRVRRSTINFPFPGESEFQFRERSINLSFTYRFNQKKKRNGSGRGFNGDGEDFEG